MSEHARFDRLTSSVNRDPIMTKNLSTRELLTIAGMIFGGGTVGFSLLLFIVGAPFSVLIGLFLALFSTMGWVLPTANAVGKFKLDKPDGYLTDFFWHTVEQKTNGLYRCAWIRPVGVCVILRRNLFEGAL